MPRPGSHPAQAPAGTPPAASAPSYPSNGPTTIKRVPGLGGVVRLATRSTVLDVSVQRVVAPIPSGSSSPDADKRFIGVKVKVHNAGHAVYNGVLYGDGTLTTQSGLGLQHDVVIDGECASDQFLKGLAPGETRQGCFVFQIPMNAKPAEVRFTPDGGFAREAASWRVPASNPDYAAYPRPDQQSFLRGCRPGGRVLCGCLLSQIEKRVAYADFQKIAQDLSDGYKSDRYKETLRVASRTCVRTLRHRGSPPGRRPESPGTERSMPGRVLGGGRSGNQGVVPRIQVESGELSGASGNQAALADQLMGARGRIEAAAAAVAGASGEPATAGAASNWGASVGGEVGALAASVGGLGSNLAAAAFSYTATDASAMPSVPGGG